MTRAISSAVKKEMFASQSADVPIILVTISHPDLDEPICVNSSGVSVVSNGVTYAPFPFELTLPNDEDSAAPKAKLVIDAIDRSIVAAIRSIQGPPSVAFQVVYYSSLDTVQASFSDFQLTNVTYDQGQVTGDLTIEDFTVEPYPQGSFTPGIFPGLF